MTRSTKTKTQLNYNLTIRSRDPIEEHYGTILEVTNSAVHIQQKKPRSSKFEVEIIPKSDIVYWYGAVNDEGNGYVCRRVPMGSELFFAGKNNPTTSVEDNGDGTFTITLTDGSVLTVNGSDISLVAEINKEEVAAKPAARGPSARAKKPAVEEEEEEEEEAPAKPARTVRRRTAA